MIGWEMKRLKNNTKLFSKDIVLILVATFFYMASPMLLNPLITGFSESIGASGSMMGIIGGAANLCSLLCRPIVGDLSDKISKYKLSFIGTVFVLISSLGYVFTWNIPVLLLLRILNGIGFSCCSVCMSTWMSGLLPSDKIGSGMGIYGTVNALSMAIAPAVGVSIMNRLGYREAFVLSALFAVGCMIAIQFVSDKGNPTVKATSKSKFELIDINVLPITFTIMFFAIPYYATQSFLVNYVQERGMNIPVSLFFPAYAAFLLIMRFSLKNLFDKLPFMVFMVVGNVGALGAMYFLFNMNNTFMMLIAAFFMALGFGTMCTVCQSTAIILAGEGKRGLANSTYYIGLDLGMTLGPILGGFIYGNIPLKYFYPCFMIAIPMCFIVYGITKFLLNKKKKVEEISMQAYSLSNR